VIEHQDESLVQEQKRIDEGSLLSQIYGETFSLAKLELWKHAQTGPASYFSCHKSSEIQTRETSTWKEGFPGLSEQNAISK